MTGYDKKTGYVGPDNKKPVYIYDWGMVFVCCKTLNNCAVSGGRR